MKKACYGLKQGPRQWWIQLNAFLRDLGFRPTKLDICLYALHMAGGVYILLLLYVDDIILTASAAGLVDQYARRIENRFRVSNIGPLENYLNIALAHSMRMHRLTMGMSAFVERVYSRFKMLPNASVWTPLQENFNAAVEEETEEDDSSLQQYLTNFLYREKVGCILYYMICMCPDLAYAVGVLSRFCAGPTRLACAGVTRVLQFMYNTRHHKLVLGGDSARITGYFDSDWASDREMRRSVSGYIILLGSGPVDWGSTRQRLVAQSTAEAEFIAASPPTKGIVWLRALLKQLGIPEVITKYSSYLLGDNMAALQMAENPVHHERTKHIAIEYFYLRDRVEAGFIAVDYVETARNIADMMPKALGNNKFGGHAKRALGGEVLETSTKRCRTEVSDEFA